MHEELFGSQNEWGGNQNPEPIFTRLAENLELDKDQFAACLEEGTYTDIIAADYQEGVAEGVTGTPAFRINGVALSGAQPFAAFQEQIEFFLAGGQPPTMEVGADSYRSMGDADAPVVITEFSDYQCPACASVEEQVIPGLIEQYVDTGKVRLVYREFPLDGLHPFARKAAEAAVCAGRQDGYWEMHDKLFASQPEWAAQDVSDPVEFFKGYAEEQGLDMDAFNQCLDSEEAGTEVQADFLAGQTMGVNATPTFFINDLPIRGGLPLEAMGRVIDYVAAGGPPPEIVPTGEDWHMLGDPRSSPAITVAFVDYASAESGQHAREVFPRLKEEYIDSGQLVYILQPWSSGEGTPGELAATAAECAGQQGKFWEMHDQIFEDQDSWMAASEPGDLFAEYAGTLDLDTASFEECLDSEWAALRVQAGSVVGALYGVPGAPVFLFNNGQGQEGSPSFDEFKTVIDSIVNQ
jgi:protein-disulfide isomerase